MLTNDPPPGTKVRFIRAAQKARANDRAILKESFGPYYPERPTDQFEVEFQGQRFIVQLQDIQEVELQESEGETES
jgi:hypothetical protein